MGYLDYTFNQTVTKVPIKRDAYGDFVYDTLNTVTDIACKFRYITDEINQQNREQVHSDAMAWFAPTEDISKGDIIIADDEYFRVRRITKARTIDNPTIQFIKTELEKWKQVVS